MNLKTSRKPNPPEVWNPIARERVSPQPNFRAMGSALEFAQKWTRRYGLPSTVKQGTSTVYTVARDGFVTLVRSESPPLPRIYLGPVRTSAPNPSAKPSAESK